jgi:hypothetical protein
MWWIILGVLGVIFGPGLLLRGAGYLVQVYKFGYTFREVYEYHKEQDALKKDRRI